MSSEPAKQYKVADLNLAAFGMDSSSYDWTASSIH